MSLHALQDTLKIYNHNMTGLTWAHWRYSHLWVLCVYLASDTRQHQTLSVHLPLIINVGFTSIIIDQILPSVHDMLLLQPWVSLNNMGQIFHQILEVGLHSKCYQMLIGGTSNPLLTERRYSRLMTSLPRCQYINVYRTCMTSVCMYVRGWRHATLYRGHWTCGLDWPQGSSSCPGPPS